MNEFEKLVCTQVSEFVRKNIKYLSNELTFYGFKNNKEMIKCIEEDFQEACWALTELFEWGMNLDYEPFVAEKLPEETIYRVENYYFTIWLDSDNMYQNIYKYQLKKQVEKTIVVWEDAE